MQVYDISVRFMRRIQIREYEPAEAEATIKMQLADNEQPDIALSESFKLASEQVHTTLGLAPDTKLPRRNAPKGSGQQTETTVTAKTAETKPAPQTQAKPQQAAASDIPDSAPAPQTQTKPQQAAASDIPDSAPAPQQAQAQTSGEQITSQELSKWIGEQVRLGKVSSQAIMGLYPKFGVSRFADLKPEKCAEAKAEIEKLISGSGTL